jgi:hypothetical protein
VPSELALLVLGPTVSVEVGAPLGSFAKVSDAGWNTEVSNGYEHRENFKKISIPAPAMEAQTCRDSDYSSRDSRLARWWGL